MFANSSPLNWHSTLRRLKKEGNMGDLGKELGVIPGKKSLENMLNGAVKSRPSHIIKVATNPAKKVVDNVHKPNKRVKKVVQQAGATDGGSEIVQEATQPTLTQTNSPNPVSEASPRHDTPAHPFSKEEDDDLSDLEGGKYKSSNEELSDMEAGFQSPKTKSKKKEWHTAKSATPQSTELKSVTRQLFSSSPAEQPLEPLKVGKSPVRRGKSEPTTPKAVVALAGAISPKGKGVGIRKAQSIIAQNVLNTPIAQKVSKPRAPRSAKKIVASKSPQDNFGYKPGAIRRKKSDGKTAVERGVGIMPRAPEVATTAPSWEGKGGLKAMKLPGLKKLATKHGIDITQHGQSPKKIKAHLKGHFNL